MLTTTKTTVVQSSCSDWRRTKYADAVLQKCQELSAEHHDDDNNNHDPPPFEIALCSSIGSFALLPSQENPAFSSLSPTAVCGPEGETVFGDGGEQNFPIAAAAAAGSLEMIVLTKDKQEEEDEEEKEMSGCQSRKIHDQALFQDSCLLPRGLDPLIQVIRTSNTDPSSNVTTTAFYFYTKEQVWLWEQANCDPTITTTTTYTQGSRFTIHRIGPNGNPLSHHPQAQQPKTYAHIPMTGLNPSIDGPYFDDSLLQHYGETHWDLWAAQRQELAWSIRPLLENHAHVQYDQYVPKHQEIIDPNLFTRQRRFGDKEETVWVPCEFDISPTGDCVHLVGGSRAHALPFELINDLATPILHQALPLLSKLRRPCLLLEGQRLQVVLKAQRIILEPKKQNSKERSSSEYMGLWHVDGKHEHVVAVVLFYYDVDEALHGGDIQFMDRKPVRLPGSKDNIDASHENHKEFSVEAIVTVPVHSGTMIVFSNYQMARRVLSMRNTSPHHAAKRDFVTLFILDPTAELLVPFRAHLAPQYWKERILTGRIGDNNETGNQVNNKAMRFTRNIVQLIMEYAGIATLKKCLQTTRNKLFTSQLQPGMGKLSRSGEPMHSTGGCVSMIEWLNQSNPPTEEIIKRKSVQEKLVARQQQRLLLLRHVALCPYPGGYCPVSQRCLQTKRLLSHMKKCERRECLVQYCTSSRCLMDHFRHCNDFYCPVCGPLNEFIRRSDVKMEYLHQQRDASSNRK